MSEKAEIPETKFDYYRQLIQVDKKYLDNLLLQIEILQQENNMLNKNLAIAKKYLNIIENYNWRSNGPSGCDSHCVSHPCGKCFTDLPDEKAIAKKALKEIEK